MNVDGELTVDDVKAMTSSTSLCEVLRAYNWDDGFEIPSAIAAHPQCDLGVALTLFWLADAISVYLDEVDIQPWQRERVDFCQRLTQGILNGVYKPGEVKFESELGRVGAYLLRKQGVPEILITGADHPT